jgi:DNA-binding MarR family transcriptional regulator
MPEIIKPQIKLNSQEQEVLQLLSREGALTPSQLSAASLMVPAEVNTLLRNLADVKLVIVREDNTADGKVVILTGEGREALYEAVSRKSNA